MNGSNEPGLVSVGASSLVKPTKPILMPPSRVNVVRRLHSAGVLPLASTHVGRDVREVGERDQRVRAGTPDPRSKLWLPRPSMSMPIMFMNSIVGVSPKKFEIGGVAPTESPAAIVMTVASVPPERCASAVVDLEPRLEERRAADGEGRVDARRGEVVGRLRQRHQLPVVVADVEDRDLGQRLAALTRCRTGSRRGRSAAPGCPSGTTASARCRSRAGPSTLSTCFDAGAGQRRTSPCMLMLFAMSTVVRQVAVLAEEVRQRDGLAGRSGVGLVRRAEHDDDVAAAVRMQRVGAVDVAQLLLVHDPLRPPACPGCAGSVRLSNAARTAARTSA